MRFMVFAPIRPAARGLAMRTVPPLLGSHPVAVPFATAET